MPMPKEWATLATTLGASDMPETRTLAFSLSVKFGDPQAISKMRGGPKLQIDYHRIADRRGKYIARVAVARKLLTLVYFGLRDGEIRSLARAEAA